MHREWTLALSIAAAVASTGLLVFQTWYFRRRFLSASAVVVPPPHPSWTLGSPQPCPYSSNVCSIDPRDLTGSECYPLVISGIVPRPIALISTVSLEGIGNLSPFSYFNAVSHDPPCIVVSICRSGQRGGKEKDTAKNILDSKEFVVSIISEWFIESANYTCAPFQPDIDEMHITHLTPSKSHKVKCLPLQRISVCRSSLAASKNRLFRWNAASSIATTSSTGTHIHTSMTQTPFRKGDVHSTVFVGEVVMYHIRQEVMTTTPSGKPAVDIAKLQPMCRLGGNIYGRITSIFELARPDRTV